MGRKKVTHEASLFRRFRMERKGSDFALQVRQQGQDEDHDLAGDEVQGDNGEEDGGDVIAEQSEAQDPEPGEAHGLRELIHLFPTVKKPLLERFGELPDVVEQACPIA